MEVYAAGGGKGRRGMEVPGLSVVSSKTEECLWEGG